MRQGLPFYTQQWKHTTDENRYRTANEYNPKRCPINTRHAISFS